MSSEGTILVSDVRERIDIDYEDLNRIANDLRSKGLIEGDQLLGKNALTINESNNSFITDPDLSFSTLLKLHKIRSELNSGAKELGKESFTNDKVISEALDHYADLKVID